MTRPGFTICICPDARLTRDRIDALLAAHPPAASATGSDSAAASMSGALGGMAAPATWRWKSRRCRWKR